MIIRTDDATIKGTSAFASDLRLNGFPRRLQLYTDGGSVRAMDCQSIDRDADGDIRFAVYGNIGVGDGAFTIFND